MKFDIIKKIIFINVIIFFLTINLNSNSKFINGNIYNYSKKKITIFLADKHLKKGYIIECKKDFYPQIIKKINILIGKKKGDKQKEGDMKTPEGIYFIKKFIPSKYLSNIYGLGAFVLDYPNIVDKTFNKTGYGIWIHGIPENIKKDSTRGCIAIKNSILLQLKKFFKKDFPIIITDYPIFISQERYKKEKTILEMKLENYLNFWEKGDFINFKKFYHKKFLNLTNFFKRKKSLFKKIKYRKIFFSDLVVLKENSTESLFMYNQLYCASNILTYGKKFLYFKDDKIIAEKYKETDTEKIIYKYINDFIINWKNAWEKRNIKVYKKFYSENFYNLKEWLKDKNEKFNKYQYIKIKISKIKIKILSPLKYKVTFLQEFHSNLYNDIGKKTLILINCPGDFKILKESWKKIF